MKDATPRKKIAIGRIHVDNVTFDEAVELIVQRALARQGGYVVTPNVDHVVLAERSHRLRDAYKGAFLSVADGVPLLWASRLLCSPLAEKISGSDLVRPLLKRASCCGLSVYLLGARPGVGARAAGLLESSMPGLRIAGVDSPDIGFELDVRKEQAVRDRFVSSNADLALVALGCPKQELLMYRWRRLGIQTVMIGVGASLDFIAGESRRAPRTVSSVGLEWLYRLIQNPLRLGPRYLVRDMRFIPILVRTVIERL